MGAVERERETRNTEWAWACKRTSRVYKCLATTSSKREKNVLINVEQIATENMTLEMHLLKIAEV